MANQDSVFGVLERDEKGPGYLRDPKRNYNLTPPGPQVPRELIQRYRLRGGESLRCRVNSSRKSRGQPVVTEIEKVGDMSPDKYGSIKPFDELEVVHPTEQLRFETSGGPPSTRIVDLLTPIGKGQRGLIVAAPRTGKTVLLQQLANGIRENHPEVQLMLLLVDERPEEVTEMRRHVCDDGSGWHEGKPEVVYSSNDKDAASHARIARLMIEKAKRSLELGKDVVILLDSLTRLGRAFNHLVGSSGRTMTGGLDIRALEHPKQMFGAARKIEGGGSLTIIASVLVETGSRMDDFIFQEFKGTGNMELVLSRELSDRRIWPAMNLSASGTRKEELLLGPEDCDKLARVRRRLLSLPPTKQMETMLSDLSQWKSNRLYLDNLAS